MMSVEETLFRAQATTSLYEEGGDGGTKHVATLSEAKPKYDELVTIDPDHETADEPGGPPEIVVQVRKRGGEVQILLDGFVSQGVDVDGTGVRQHRLTWHRGLHEDVSTNTRVFSPLAVVAAMEDGQHPFQSVTVSVVHQLHFYDTPVLVPTVLAEATLEPHRVTDARCSVVHVPYPLAFPVPPTLTIFDNITRLRIQERKKLLQVGAGWETAFRQLNTAIDANQENNPANFLESLIVAGFAMAPPALLALANTAFSLANWPLTSIAILGTIRGVVGTTAGDIDGDDAWMARVFVGLLSGATGAVTTYLRMPPEPPLRKTKFTLAELAGTIEALALVREFTPTEEEFAAILPNEDKAQYMKEQTVWSWLLDTSGKIPVPDTRQLAASKQHTSSLHIRVAVDDALGCDAGPEYHEIRCGRADDVLLAAAAAGSLEDLARLYHAIAKLSDVLAKSIQLADTNEPGRWGWHWIDRAKYNAWHAMRAYQAHVNKYENRSQGWVAVKFDAFRKAWLSSGLGTDFKKARKAELTTVKEQLKGKLVQALFLNESPGWQLRYDIEQALAKRKVPVSPAKHWVRKLPQRGPAGAVRSLFSASVDDSVARIDVQTEGVLTRMYSEYRDASAWFSASMASSRVALRRYVIEWEASTETRVLLTCVCTDIADNLPRFTPAAAHSTLALTTPADIRFSEAISVPTEHAQRRIRLVVRRAQGGYDKSPLEALGLVHSNVSLLVCQTFGDLWVDELRALWDLGDSKQAEMLERASTRATVRLRAAGTLLRELLPASNPSTELGGGAGVAPSRSDPSLVATQVGRDAGRLLDRVLFTQNYLSVRVAMAPLLRETALVAVRAAQAFERAVPVALPHEPAASLFGYRLDGVAAWLRVRNVAETDAVALEAATAAYPSVRLLASTDAEQAAYAAKASRRGVPEPSTARPMTMRTLVGAMRFRLAGLRMDEGPALNVAASPTSTVDALAERLSRVDVTAGAGASFYVPFGFGDARPAPTLPPCAAPMFGSVPVFRDGLVQAFKSIRGVLEGNASASGVGARVLRVRLAPVLGCLLPLKGTHGDDEAESVHPNVVQVVRGGSADEVTVRYAASGAPGGDAGGGATMPATAYAAAEAHVRSATTVRLASVVSSVAWNAERVVQAVVAALASADEAQDYDAIELSLTLPPDDKGSSPWYSKPENPMHRAQQKRMRTRTVDVEVEFLEQLTKNYGARVNALINELGIPSLEARSGYTGFAAKLLVVTDREQVATTSSWSGVVNDAQGALEQLIPPNELEEIAEAKMSYMLQPTGEVVFDAAQKAETLLAWTTERDSLKAQAKFVEELQTTLISSLKLGQPIGIEYDAYRAALGVPPVVDAEDTARKDAEKRRKERQYRAIVGALGVGMGILAPLVVGLRQPLRCVEIERNTGTVPDDPFETWGVGPLEEAFGKCDALRFSEVCVILVGQL